MDTRLVFVGIGSAVLPNNNVVSIVEGLEAVLSAIVCYFGERLLELLQDLPGNSGPWQQLLAASCQAESAGCAVLSLLVPVWAQTDTRQASYYSFYF